MLYISTKYSEMTSFIDYINNIMIKLLKNKPKKRSTSHHPPGEETPNAWTSGRRKGKPLVTMQLVFKHRQPTSTPLQMKQRKQTSTTATPKPSTFQQYRPKKKGAIDTDKMHIYWFATKTNKIRPGRSSTHRSLSRVYT
jgi:hypothetical protein